MGLFSPGSKPRQFEYKARYHDPDAEAREVRRRMILGDEYAEGEYRPGMYIREKRLLRMQNRDQVKRAQNKVMMIRTVIFLVLAVAVVYIMFTYFGRAFQ